MHNDARIRYYCFMGELSTPSAPEKSWSDHGFDYLSALQETGIPIRALPIMNGDPRSGRWSVLQGELISIPVAELYCNVVCAPCPLLERYFTARVRNVAITQAPALSAIEDRGQARSFLERFASILCPMADDVATFAELGVEATLAPANDIEPSMFAA